MDVDRGVEGPTLIEKPQSVRAGGWIQRLFLVEKFPDIFACFLVADDPGDSRRRRRGHIDSNAAAPAGVSTTAIPGILRQIMPGLDHTLSHDRVNFASRQNGIIIINNRRGAVVVVRLGEEVVHRGDRRRRRGFSVITCHGSNESVWEIGSSVIAYRLQATVANAGRVVRRFPIQFASAFPFASAPLDCLRAATNRRASLPELPSSFPRTISPGKGGMKGVSQRGWFLTVLPRDQTLQSEHFLFKKKKTTLVKYG